MDAAATTVVAASTPATPAAGPKSCKHGWGCYGRKNGKCPFDHGQPPAGEAAAPASAKPSGDTKPKKVACKFGDKCNKGKECTFKHPRDKEHKAAKPADPNTVQGHLKAARTLAKAGGNDLLNQQIHQVTQASEGRFVNYSQVLAGWKMHAELKGRADVVAALARAIAELKPETEDPSGETSE